VAVAAASGCAAKSTTQQAHPDQPVELGQVIEAVQASVDNTVSQRVQQVSNDLWPWVAAIGIAALGAVGLVVGCLAVVAGLVRAWIRRSSYLEQKPVYERRRANGQAQECSP